MKKLISIIPIFIIFFNSSFAYTPNEKDETLLINIYQKVDKLNTNSFQKLYNQVNILKSKYKNNEKVDYLITEL
jgi:hypothetical protein